ncbi:MAG: radical SAM mobile pair protein B [Spirochaetes bacterium]|uniref:Radical SAM mobile pair protein B n=1 Tax=Candidatus Ornithospirochaeta stercoripullorum TaxID=2840899 RepID=A0A9D9E1S4_9SPIO|nr:radical SAM mobile pair protein B [Candidatus Ornithospirochaeta stercoripullorum]
MVVLIKSISCKSILTKSNLPVGDYSANPYIGCNHGCKYCYASFMKRFTNHPEAWGEFVDVKYWNAIKHPERYSGKEIFIGSVTDPYQEIEESAKRTRALLEELKGSGCRISIATKSDLVLRDLDLIKTFHDARVSFSINTLDENFRSDMDNAVSIERRLEAMHVLHEAGIRTTCFISPIFPGITDVKSIIERAKDDCNLIWLENLNLRGAYKKTILDYISERHPELSMLYDEIYRRGNREYWYYLDEEIREFSARIGLEYLRNDDSMERSFDSPPIVVNYFFHEEIIPSAHKKNSIIPYRK